MAVRVAINGFGRIGRLALRLMLFEEDIEVVALNDLAPAATNAHLLKYDSTHGVFPKEVEAGEGFIIAGGKKIATFEEKDPYLLPWKDLKVDVVIESTGKFNDARKAAAHISAGAAKVLLSAPGKNEDITIVMGVNQNDYNPGGHHIISNASCTTNALAPVAKVLNREFGIESGLMTTIHACTNDQNILDQSHKDLRRARAGFSSIIPTTTGAARAVALVLPELKGKLNGFALRVPTPNVSVIDLTLTLGRKASAEDINAALKKAAEGELKGILGVSDLPLVSIDYNGCRNSSVVDALSTMVCGSMSKVVAWYDNEWGYSNRLVDLLKYIAERL